MACYCMIVKFLILIVLSTVEVQSTSLSDCAYKSIGVEAKGIIPDSSFTATSHTSYQEPSAARLESNLRGWAPSMNDNPNDYLQIDLGAEYSLCAVATQGRSDYTAYVNTYKIMFSLDYKSWTTYTKNGQQKVFDGNIDSNSIVRHHLNKPLGRYIRFIPISYFHSKTLRVGVFGYSKYEACLMNPLGMESRAIPDNHLSASSSSQSASNARLQSASSWCASSSDSSPYLQIDLGSDHVVCAVATQGNSAADQWVTSYQIVTSSDESSWRFYTESNTTRVFFGNYDRSSVVRQVLYHSPVTRYIRIFPKTFLGSICLRIELYGYQLQPVCSSHSVGIPSSIIVPNLRITATSYFDNSTKPYYGRLDFKGTWMTLTNKFNDFLQIDLGDTFYICAVLTQGNGLNSYYWVTSYKILFSVDNKWWTTYSELSGVEKVFTGNTGKTRVVTNSIKYPFKAKFVRVLPTSSKGWKAIRVDFKGTPQACTSPLGMENPKEISDSSMTSSSVLDNTHDASRGRLYSSSSWCSRTTALPEYIQVDLGQAKTVTGIATQGDPLQKKWVTTYNVMYSLTGGQWYDYKEREVTKVFTGNKNQNEVSVNWLSRPIGARYVRIIAVRSSGGRCLRFDLYGCDHYIAPKATFSDPSESTLTSKKGSSITLKCSVIGEPQPRIQWFTNTGKMIPGATQTTLQVSYISAEDIMSKFTCTRRDPNTRLLVCSANYTCRVMYPVNEATATLIVKLNVPVAPTFTVFANTTSLRLHWNPFEIIADDVGMITWYDIEFNNGSMLVKFNVPHPTAEFNLKTHLKPFTEYSVRMKAISTIGSGFWSSWTTINTSPAILANKEDSTKLIAKLSLVPIVILLATMASLSLAVNGFLLHRLYRSKKQTQNSPKPSNDEVTLEMTCNKINNLTDGPPQEPSGQRNSAYSELPRITDNVIYESIKESDTEVKSVTRDYETVPEPALSAGDGKQSLLQSRVNKCGHV